MAKMTFALIREQGVEFAIVMVRHSAFAITSQRRQAASSLTQHFMRPVALMDEETGETFGRADIVNFLSHVHPSRIPWREKQIGS